jgi:hypothetical protein
LLKPSPDARSNFVRVDALTRTERRLLIHWADNSRKPYRRAMRVFRSYRCDYGHHWEVHRHDSEEEQPSDGVCPEGHPAITCCVELPVDDVQILISPAARVVDQLRRQRILGQRYYLSLLDKTGAELCASRDHYDWDTAVQFASFFKDKSAEQALAWWSKRNL